MGIGALTNFNWLRPVSAAGGGVAPSDPNEATLRMLLTRIKHSRLSRTQRDALCGMVRSLAADERLDAKAAKGILEVVNMLEMTAKAGRKKEPGLFPFEKTVGDEMGEIGKSRSTRRAMKENLAKLESSFSKQE